MLTLSKHDVLAARIVDRLQGASTCDELQGLDNTSFFSDAAYAPDGRFPAPDSVFGSCNDQVS